MQIRLRQEVTGLRRTPSGAVSGVVVGDEVVGADVVVATGDLPTMYDVLLPGARRPLPLRRPRYSPSAVVWHVGTADPAPDDVRHHNIHFGHEWARSFDELLDEQVLMRDPSRLVSVPSVTDPARARPGGAVMYVLEPAPHLGGPLDWDRMREPMKERLTKFLATSGYPTDIVSEQLVTPGDWADQGLTAGTPFALAHTLLAVRAVPSHQLRARCARFGLRRGGYDAGGRGAHGPGQRQTRRATRSGAAE